MMWYYRPGPYYIKNKAHMHDKTGCLNMKLELALMAIQKQLILSHDYLRLSTMNLWPCTQTKYLFVLLFYSNNPITLTLGERLGCKLSATVVSLFLQPTWKIDINKNVKNLIIKCIISQSFV